MKKFHKQRLLKLADFLDKLPPKKFNFGKVIEKIDEKGCGAVCCAIGWTPAVFPKLVKWNDKNLHVGVFKNIAIDLFGITENEASHLFIPWAGYDAETCGVIGNNLTHKTHPKTVAKHIRNWVNKQK